MPKKNATNELAYQVLHYFDEELDFHKRFVNQQFLIAKRMHKLFPKQARAQRCWDSIRQLFYREHIPDGADFTPQRNYYSVLGLWSGNRHSMHPEAIKNALKRGQRRLETIGQDIESGADDKIRLEEACRIISDQKQREAYNRELDASAKRNKERELQRLEREEEANTPIKPCVLPKRCSGCGRQNTITSCTVNGMKMYRVRCRSLDHQPRNMKTTGSSSSNTFDDDDDDTNVKSEWHDCFWTLGKWHPICHWCDQPLQFRQKQTNDKARKFYYTCGKKIKCNFTGKMQWCLFRYHLQQP